MKFMSKSAYPKNQKGRRISYVKQQVLVNIRPYFHPTIFWFGSVGDEFFTFGAKLGFDCRLFTGGDLSVLLHAKAFVIKDIESCVNLPRIPIGFARCYGIRLVWLNQNFLPLRWMWSFDLIINEDISPGDFYNRLCQLIV